MKNLLKSIALVTAAAIAMAIPVSAEAPEKLVVFGDSITSGYGLEGYTSGDNTSADGSFTNMLADKYDLSDGDSYINFAVDGMTTAGLLGKLSDADSMAALEDADNVVISIGGNDLLMVFFSVIQTTALENADMFVEMGIQADLTTIQGLFTALSQALSLDTDGAFLKQFGLSFTKPETASKFTDAATTAIANATQIMTTIYTINPEADVYILTVYNPFESMAGFESVSAIADLVLKALNSGYARIAETMQASGYNMTVVDVNQLFKGKAMELTNIASLDIHPNADGHNAIYEALYSVFTDNVSVGEESVDVSDEGELTTEETTESSDESVDDVDTESDGTVESIGATESVDADETDGAADAPTTEKGSPDTGVGGLAAIAGIGILAAGTVIISKKRR